VEFEPTAGQAPLDRPLPPQDAATTNPFANPLQTEPNRDFAGRTQDEEGLTPPAEPVPSPFRIYYYLLPFLVVCTALIIFLSRRYALQARVPVFLRATFERSGLDVPVWVIHWENWMKLSPVEKAFESINFALRQLGGSVPVHVTPIERAAQLTRLLPGQAAEIKVLLDEHQTSLYTSRVADVTQARRAALDIRKQVILERFRRLFFGKPTP
jgi:hypothetical protein